MRGPGLPASNLTSWVMLRQPSMVQQIMGARGQSGANRDYVLNLAKNVEKLGHRGRTRAQLAGWIERQTPKGRGIYLSSSWGGLMESAFGFPEGPSPVVQSFLIALRCPRARDRWCRKPVTTVAKSRMTRVLSKEHLGLRPVAQVVDTDFVNEFGSSR